MLEVEQKFRVDEEAKLLSCLEAIGAVADTTEIHEDIYYAHPARDFRQTTEALRIRVVNGVPMITYKGPKLPGSMKVRKELEWRLDPGDPCGRQTMEMLDLLGFKPVATVRKSRNVFRLSESHLTVAVDNVERLGLFAEIECLVSEVPEIDGAKKRIQQAQLQLGLEKKEKRSYLGMLLELSES